MPAFRDNDIDGEVLRRLTGEDHQVRQAEARDLLVPFHSWFTEGFNAQDLKEAKALLEGLT